MNKEILVDASGVATRVAVVEDGSPVELYVEQEGTERLVGNIYNGKVQNVLPGMQAAFIDIGLERNAFLYAGDIVLSDDPDDMIEQMPESKNIRDLLKPGQTIIVQVAKDPVGTKGARVTTHITLAGRSLVLMPTMDYVGVSRRIDKDEERQRLRKILNEIKPKGMGVIVRTASAGKTKQDFSEDLESIVNLYAEIEKRAAAKKAPAILHAEQSLLFRTARDLLMKDIDRVFVNDTEAYDKLREIADVMAPKLKARILLKESEALFDRYDTESKIEKALSRKVWLKSGGYVIIDRTEALTSIDVNSPRNLDAIASIVPLFRSACPRLLCELSGKERSAHARKNVPKRGFLRTKTGESLRLLFLKNLCYSPTATSYTLTCFLPRCLVSKRTTPSTVAKSVSSLPMPTLLPGWKCVPR